MSSPESGRIDSAWRASVYLLLIAVASGTILGRLWTVRSSLGETPLLSANDRSRWAHVRSLVDHGTFAIDDVIFQDAAQTKRDREWYTIDMVRHKGGDGREHFYSSKPPLLATLVAGQYWVLQRLTGMTLAEQPFYVVRVLLITSHLLPLLLYFLILAQLIERHGRTDWGRLLVMITATFGTFLTTFAVTLNNHVVSAVSVAIATWAALRIWREDSRQWTDFALAGLASAFAVANELPALSFFGLIGLAAAWRSPLRTAAAFVPAALLVAAASLGINWLAHGSWRVPYAHRSDGPLVAEVSGVTAEQLQGDEVTPELRTALESQSLTLSPQAVVRPRLSGQGWMLWDPVGENRWALALEADKLCVRVWDHWYEYEGSYWFSPKKTGVDLGEPSLRVYAFQSLLGHHGVFSLTPIWLLAIGGLVGWLRHPEDRMRGFAVLVLTLTVVCLTFYIVRPVYDRNYGGVACGFRWAFWLIPLWLIGLLPAADWIGRSRLGRWIAVGLLLVSVMSASYASLNPWSHPWLYRYWAFLGWIQP
jgi:hypothetical protein